MNEKFHSLNIYFKTFILAVIFSFFSFILLLPLAIFGWMEIPLGLIVGEVISFTSYLVFGLVDKRGVNDKKSNRMIVAVLIVRVLLLAIVSTLSALLYYYFNHHIFNVFAIIGGYFIPLIIFIVLALLERKKNERSI